MVGFFSLLGAENDNDVEWYGVFSLPEDRSPERPGKNEPFTVELRVFRGDITAARVRSWDGAAELYDMSWSRNEDPYEVWQATVAGTSSDYLYYRFEIVDGSDTDYYNALGMSNDEPASGDFLILTTPLGHYPLGATVTPGGTVFRLWAPNAIAATVAGNFNGWSTTANPLVERQGFWELQVPGADHGHEYKFVLNGNIWRTDPRARSQIHAASNSVIVDSDAYVWGDDGWPTPAFEELILYELHVGTFSGEGDKVSHYPGRFRDVVDTHLSHLEELGVNAIELMPVGEFAGDISWGYNPAFLYAPESVYGGASELKVLVDRCHQSGIAVILDVVYNHMGPGDLAGNLLEYDGEEIYFYPEGNTFRETPWGPRLDYGRREVREFILENIRYWLEEYHVDGFRLDATDFIKVNAEGWELLKDIARTVDAVSPRAIVIAEQLPNDPAVTRSTTSGGAGADAQWNDRLHDNLRVAIGASDPEMHAVAAGVNHFGYAGTEMVNYIESHDEAAVDGRISRAADRSDPDSAVAYGKSKVALALVLFSSGIPMLLQGQELLEDRPFGDKREHRIQWSYRASHADFFLYTEDAIGLRRSQAALKSSAPQDVFHVNDGANVLAFHRWTDSGDDLVIVVSLNSNDFESYRLGFPLGGDWFEVLNSDASVYGGGNLGNGGMIRASGGPMHGFGQSAEIVLPRYGVLVFTRAPLGMEGEPGFLGGDCYRDGTVDIADPMQALWVLFAGAEPGDCFAACDANADNTVNVADPVYLLSFLFGGGTRPAPPWPDCGPNPRSLPCSMTCPE